MSTTDQSISAIVLAAGRGTRMHSRRPKVLQTLLGEPMLALLLEALRPICGERLRIVAGYGADELRDSFPDLHYVIQEKQLGTGHAVQCALAATGGDIEPPVLVVNGDAPLLGTETIREFVRQAAGQDLAFATAVPDDPAEYGRVFRDNGMVRAIVEVRDYDPEVHGRESGEVNAGLYLLNTRAALKLLAMIEPSPRSGEFYITEIVRLAVENGLKVEGVRIADAVELMGVNSPRELAGSEELLRRRIVATLLDAGVVIHAPELVRVSPFALIEPGVELHGPCEIYGRCHIADGARIASHCVIRDSMIGRDARIASFSHLDHAHVGETAIVGPYARLRPGAILGTGSHVGNFVELKKTTLGSGSKANHLSYLGDAQIGEGVNIGAGTITCNYDGHNKFPTGIGSGSFIGSNTSLVAPVRIGANSLVGAGSVITKDVPEDSLAIGRARQINLPRKK